MSDSNSSNVSEPMPSTIPIVQGYFGTLRSAESRTGSGGFQHFGTAMLSPVLLREIEPLLIPLPGTLSTVEKPVLLFTRLSNTHFLLVKTTVCLDETDDYGRPRGFLSTFCLVKPDDFTGTLQGQPFALFNDRRLWPESYREVLSIINLPPASADVLHSLQAFSKGIPLTAPQDSTHCLEDLRDQEQQLIELGSDSVRGTLPRLTLTADAYLPSRLEKLLSLAPVDLRPSLSFDTGAVGTGGRRRQTSIRCLIEGSRDSGSAASLQSGTLPNCLVQYCHWSRQQPVDRAQFLSEDHCLFRSNMFRAFRHMGGLPAAPLLLGSPAQQLLAWETVLHTAANELRTSISHALQSHSVPGGEADILARRYIELLPQQNPDPALLQPGRLQINLLCQLLRQSSRPSDPEWYRWDVNTVAVCVKQNHDWTRNPQEFITKLSHDRRYMLGILLILKQQWTELTVLLTMLEPDDLTELLTWSISYFNPRLSYLPPIMERFLVWLGLRVITPGPYDEQYRRFVRVVADVGCGELFTRLLTAHECRRSAKLPDTPAQRHSGKAILPMATSTAPRGNAANSQIRPDRTWILLVRGGQVEITLGSEGSHAQIPKLISQQLLRAAKQPQAGQIVVRALDEVWAMELIPCEAGLQVVAVSTDARQHHDLQQHPLDLLRGTFPGLVKQPGLPLRDRQTAKIGRRVVLTTLLAIATGQAVEIAGAETCRAHAYFAFCQNTPLALREHISLQLTPDQLLLAPRTTSADNHSLPVFHVHCDRPGNFDDTEKNLFSRLVLATIDADLPTPLQPDESRQLADLYSISAMLENRIAGSPAVSITTSMQQLLPRVRATAPQELQQALLSRLQASLGNELGQLLAETVLPHLQDDHTLQVLARGFNLLWLAELATEKLQQLTYTQLTEPLRKQLHKLLNSDELNYPAGTPCRLVIAMLLDDPQTLPILLHPLSTSPERSDLLQLLEQQVQFRYRAVVLPSTQPNADLMTKITSKHAAPCAAFWQAAHNARQANLLTALMNLLLHADNSFT
ncbi:MAG: hypothetical protein ACKO3T_05130 [Planctomycetaceae bacterium]